MHPPERLETQRLLLRKLVVADAPTLFERWTRSPEVTEFLIWSPHETLAESEEHARTCEARWREGSAFTWIIEARESGTAVGSIAGYRQDFAVEMAYLMAPDSWGLGYMTEALVAVSDWFLTQAGIHRVWAEVDAGNAGSARVLEKAGFEREGLLRRSIMSPNVDPEPRDAIVFARVV